MRCAPLFHLFILVGSLPVYIIASEKILGFSYGDESERWTGEGFNSLASPTTIKKQLFLNACKFGF
jgi:hypothetical protein